MNNVLRFPSKEGVSSSSELTETPQAYALMVIGLHPNESLIVQIDELRAHIHDDVLLVRALNCLMDERERFLAESEDTIFTTVHYIRALTDNTAQFRERLQRGGRSGPWTPDDVA